MGSLGTLTEEEIALIHKHRKERARIAEANARRLEVLEVAAAYERWLQLHQCGSSYSTFVNEFGYEGRRGDHVFHVVESLCEKAREAE